MKLFYRILTGALVIFLNLGFRTFNAKWDISKNDPTIWIKLCEGSATRIGENDITTSDPLKGISNITLNQVLQSIIDDYNNIPTSYVRLAMYPTDPNNPGTPVDGDSTFTIEKAEKRTIEICFGETDPNMTSGGYAVPVIADGYFTGCEIKSKTSHLDKAKNVTYLLAHELGHCLGLAHPQDGTNSVMSYFDPTRPMRLKDDDKAGITFFYPNEDHYAEEISTFGITSCEPRNR